MSGPVILIVTAADVCVDGVAVRVGVDPGTGVRMATVGVRVGVAVIVGVGGVRITTIGVDVTNGIGVTVGVRVAVGVLVGILVGVFVAASV